MALPKLHVGKKSPCGPISERKDAILLLQILLRPGSELRCSFYRVQQTNSCASSVPSEKHTAPGVRFLSSEAGVIICSAPCACLCVNR
jgi:hypothetical protein